MTISICNEYGDVKMPSLHWSEILNLAFQAGWEPAGTLPPENGYPNDLLPPAVYEDWTGSYFTNDFQHVSDDDAMAIADALLRVLDQNPNKQAQQLFSTVDPILHSVAPNDPVEQLKPQFPPGLKLRPHEGVDMCAARAGFQSLLGRVIAIAMHGGFVIY